MRPQSQGNLVNYAFWVGRWGQQLRRTRCGWGGRGQWRGLRLPQAPEAAHEHTGKEPAAGGQVFQPRGDLQQPAHGGGEFFLLEGKLQDAIGPGFQRQGLVARALFEGDNPDDGDRAFGFNGANGAGGLESAGAFLAQGVEAGG